MSIMDNLGDVIERLPGFGGTQDVTAQPTYDPDKPMGPASDQARDFLEAGGINAVSADYAPSGSATDLNGDDDASPSPDVKTLNGVNAQATVNIAAPLFNTAQFGVATNAVRVIGNNDSRVAVTILNMDDTATLYVGSNSSVTVDSGFPIGPGNSLTVAISAEVWMVADQAMNGAYIEYLAA